MRVRKSNTILRLLRVSLIVFAVSILAMPVIVSAEQLNFPLKAYTDEELTKVREWEKTWAGKKLIRAMLSR